MRSAFLSSGCDLQRPHRAALLEDGLGTQHEVELELGLLVAHARFLFEAGDALLQAFEVGQHQLGLDRLGVRDRVDPALDMGDVVVLEASDDVGDGVDLADIGEELVAETLALARAAHEARDVDEGEAGRDDLLGMGELGQPHQARIGHRDLADIGLDRAEGIVLGLRGGRLRERIEEGGLADIRQAHDAAFEAHGGRSFRIGLGSVWEGEGDLEIGMDEVVADEKEGKTLGLGEAVGVGVAEVEAWQGGRSLGRSDDSLQSGGVRRVASLERRDDRSLKNFDEARRQRLQTSGQALARPIATSGHLEPSLCHTAMRVAGLELAAARLRIDLEKTLLEQKDLEKGRTYRPR